MKIDPKSIKVGDYIQFTVGTMYMGGIVDTVFDDSTFSVDCTECSEYVKAEHVIKHCPLERLNS